MANTRTETHELSVSGTPELHIQNRAGNVTLTAGAGGQVHVEVTKRLHGKILGASDADFDRVNVEVSQDGDRIEIDTKYQAGARNVSVDLDIATPPASNLEMHVNAGNSHIAGITGQMRTELNAGNFETSGVTLLGQSRFNLNAGTLVLECSIAPEASVDVRVNAGNARVTLPPGAPVTLDARTHAGSIHSNRTGGRLEVVGRFASSSASGALGPNPTAKLSIRVDAGNITIGD